MLNKVRDLKSASGIGVGEMTMPINSEFSVEWYKKVNYQLSIYLYKNHVFINFWMRREMWLCVFV